MYSFIWLDDISMTSPALLNDCYPFGVLLSLNDCWQVGVLFLLNDCWKFGKIVLLNTRWQFGVHVLLNIHWRFGAILSLNSNDRVSSFYWTRGSKLCVLTRFSYFSCYFLILVFLQNCYSLISLCLSRLHGNPISCPIFLYLWHFEVVDLDRMANLRLVDKRGNLSS
jgi:hypothetical protein